MLQHKSYTTTILFKNKNYSHYNQLSMTHAKFSRQNFAVARGDITFHWKYSVVFMSLVFCAPELYFSCKKRKVAGTHVAIILKYISWTIIVRRSLESAKPFVNEEDKA